MKTALVIGGGVGGLTVACALARRGVSVTLLEQAERIAEVGAGLQISPNGLAVLRALGVEPALSARGAVRGQAVVLRDYVNGAQVARLDLMRLSSDQRYYFVHRADLIDTLLAAAQDAGVQIETGCRVARVLPGPKPQVALEGGKIRGADVVIAADGLHSNTRAVLNGPDKAAFTGQAVWRAVVPNSRNHPPEAQVTMGPGRHLVSYPLRDSAFVNLVAAEERTGWTAEGWNHPDDPAHLRTAFAGFGGPAGALIKAVTDVTLWGLHRHPVAGCWHREGVALLGDAAHPTLPYLAQGANMAMEDAWVLAHCVAEMSTEQALATYQNARETRVRRTINAANGNASRYHLRPGPVRLAAHLGLRMGSRLVPGRMIGAFDWLYRHDVTAEFPGKG